MQTQLSLCRILVVEDDTAVARTIRSGLEASGYEVTDVQTGEEALRLLPEYRPHLMVLDLGLPGIGGLEVLRRMRENQDETRVLVLTAQNEVEDRILGLRKGADDYLGKPFSIAELAVRAEVLLRRGSNQETTPILQLADLTLHREAHTATRAGIHLSLTQREFGLLVYLLKHTGRTVSREMLARDVWQETARFTPINNVIDVQMTRLRQKIDDPFPKRLLHTVRGVGYSLREPES